MPHQEPSTESSILVLHSQSLDPYPFLARLIGTAVAPSQGAAAADLNETEAPDGNGDDTPDHVPWKIDNKYYTADVTFHPQALVAAPGALVPRPVVLYLFDGQAPNPLPAALTRLAVLDPPPDISLAVRIKSNNSYGPLKEDAEERFDEIGMEVVDEIGDPDDDDERPIDPLDTVRQTLMTHIWPNMRRKNAGPRRDIPRPEVIADDDDSSGDDEQSGNRIGDTTTASQFPVSFSAGAVSVANVPGPASDFPTPEPQEGATDEDDEPNGSGLDGYAPLATDDDDFGAFSSGNGPPALEYARLDAWLDDDGDGEAEPDRDGAERHFPPLSATAGYGRTQGPRDTGAFGFHQFTDEDELPGFDDDFGPMPGMGDGDLSLPLDPTPLLLHLQNVRAELAGVEDEDERRRRAAEEVTRVMASLGMGGGSAADWLDEDLDVMGLGGDGLDVDQAAIDRLDRI